MYSHGHPTLNADAKHNPSVLFDENQVDLTVYPKIDGTGPAHQQDQLTIGDLHASALKFLYFLVRHNVLEISAAEYAELVEIYNTDLFNLSSTDAIRGKLNRFKEILANARVNPCNINIVGDEVSDRGKNDYYILLILKKLKEANVKTQILLSNHGIGFLEDFSREGQEPTLTNWALGHSQARSHFNLGRLVELGIVTKSELKQLVDECYKPNLLAINYTVDLTSDPEKISIFTHAPVGLETLKALARDNGIRFDDSSIDSLCNTIDQINIKIKQDIADGSLITEYKIQATKNGPLGGDPVSSKYPLVRLLWNRVSPDPEINQRNLPTTVYGNDNYYDLTFIHGHDGGGIPVNPRIKNMVNLDNTLGKNDLNVGFYKIYRNRETSALNLAMERIRFPKKKKSAFEIFTRKHPYAWGFLKWIVIPAVISGIVLATGGLALIPFGAAAAFAIATAAISLVGNGFNYLRKLCCKPAKSALLPSQPSTAPSVDSPRDRLLGSASEAKFKQDSSHPAPIPGVELYTNLSSPIDRLSTTLMGGTIPLAPDMHANAGTSDAAPVCQPAPGPLASACATLTLPPDNTVRGAANGLT